MENRKRQQEDWEERRKREDAERARWKRAEPKLLEALAAKLKVTPALDLVDLVLDQVATYGHPTKSKHMPRGETLDDAVRLAAFLSLAKHSTGWSAHEVAPKLLKKYGIDAKKIVDQVAPKPKDEPKKAAKKAAPAKTKPGADRGGLAPDLVDNRARLAKKKPGARARRRGKKAAVQTSAPAEV